MSLTKKSLLESLFDYVSYLQKLRQVIKWAKHEYQTRPFSIRIALPDFNTTLAFKASTESVPHLIFCNPESSIKELYPSVTWVCIYNSLDVQVWENTGNFIISPIRHGLSGDEKRVALETARSAALCFIEKKCSIHTFVPTTDTMRVRFSEITTVGVAIWVDGVLRASTIEMGKSLEQGIRQASKRLCTDPRSKPLTKEDIERGVIEITLFNSLAITLSRTDVRADVIIPTNGYKATAFGATGWYIPETFNVQNPPPYNLEHFLKTLAFQKIGIPPEQHKKVVFYTFVVQIFIGLSPTKIISMTGPVPHVNTDSYTVTNFINECEKTGHELASQLITQQQANGNIIPFLNPTTGKHGTVDWIRLSCSAWALAEFGRTTHTPQYVDAAKKALQYILANMSNLEISEAETIAITIYLIRTKKTLGEDYSQLLNNLKIKCSESIPYQAIVYANCASLFASEAENQSSFLELAKKYAEIVYLDFRKQITTSNSFELAQYPEIIPALLSLHTATQDQVFLDRAKEITQWYVTNQLSSGAFPAKHLSPTPAYSRGTGKIFEAISLFYPEYQTALMHTMTWIRQVQYTESSLYFVPPALHKHTLGSLRQSVLKTSTAIDASAHVLIGISRLIHSTSLITHNGILNTPLMRYT